MVAAWLKHEGLVLDAMRVAASLSEAGKDANKRSSVKVYQFISPRNKQLLIIFSEPGFHSATARGTIARAWGNHLASSRTTTQHCDRGRDQHRNTTKIFGDTCAYDRERGILQGYLYFFSFFLSSFFPLL